MGAQAQFIRGAGKQLQADLVRQWHDGLREDLLSSPKALTALVRWDKALVLQGLAREEGLRSRTQRLSAFLFRVTFEARS